MGNREVGLYPLELQALGTPLTPLGLLDSRTLEWRASQAGTYRVTLRPGGDVARERLLAAGTVAAYEPVLVKLLGAELDPGAENTITVELVDPVGRTVALTQAPDLSSPELIALGAGTFADLCFDAPREELVVLESGAGELRMIDVAALAPGYGLPKGALSIPPGSGPALRCALGAAGRYGFLLERDALRRYDRDTLELLETLPLPADEEPSGLALTPDAGRAYFAQASALLFQRLDAPGGPAPIEGTGIVAPGVEGGESCITPDGARLLFAWQGATERGLMVVDSDPTSLDYHELLVDDRYEASAQAGAPGVAVAPSGRAAYVLGLQPGRLEKRDLQQADAPVVAAHEGLFARRLLVARVGDAEFVLAIGEDGELHVLDEQLTHRGSLHLPGGVPLRLALDPDGGRLFVLSATAGGTAEVVVLVVSRD